MSEQPTNIQERFGLRRPNFVLDPIEDADFFAHRTGVSVEEIIEDLQIDLVTGLAPKRLFWGPYGGGKTHTLHKTMKVLQRQTPVHPVYVQCPDVAPRSTFLELYRDGIMRSMGQSFVLELFKKAIDRAGVARREEFVERLKELIGDEDLANLASLMMTPNFKTIKLWAWISGVPVSRTDLEELNQTQDLTSAEPARLAETVAILGRLLRELTGETLILILDEMDRLRFVGENTITTFRTGFTRLVDPNQNTVAVLIGCSAVNLDQMPEVFAIHPGNPVWSRLGSGSCKHIPALDQPDVKRFVTDVIDYVRNPEANIPELCEKARATTEECVEIDLFPFTVGALEALESKLGQDMTPREITVNMTHAAGRAYQMNRAAVTSEAIR